MKYARSRFSSYYNVRSKSKKIGPSNIELDTEGMELDKLAHVKKIKTHLPLTNIITYIIQ